MALYVSEHKQNLYLGNTPMILHIFTPTPMTNGIRLKSSEDYILKDSRGVYLTATKESDE